MSIFKPDAEVKRMIFNIDAELADRLEAAKEQSRSFGKRLDVDNAINKALEKFLKKVDKKLEEMRRESKDEKKGGKRGLPLGPEPDEDQNPGENRVFLAEIGNPNLKEGSK